MVRNKKHGVNLGEFFRSHTHTRYTRIGERIYHVKEMG